MAKKKDNLKDVTFIEVPVMPRDEVVKKFYEAKGPVMLTEVPRIPPLTETEKLTDFELEQFEQQLIIDGTDVQVRKLVNEVKAQRKLMNKYGIPNLEYLEQCIKRSDKYGELEEKIGCPFEVRCNVISDTLIYDKDGNEWFVEWISFSHFGASCNKLSTKSAFGWNAYKKYWWLKKDKSE